MLKIDNIIPENEESNKNDRTSNSFLALKNMLKNDNVIEENEESNKNDRKTSRSFLALDDNVIQENVESNKNDRKTSNSFLALKNMLKNDSVILEKEEESNKNDRERSNTLSGVDCAVLPSDAEYQCIPAKNIQSAENTEDSNEALGFETSAQYVRRMHSIRVLYLTLFLIAVGFSSAVTVAYVFIKEVQSYDETFYSGIVIAAHSCGQFAMSPVAGWMFSRFHKSKPPMLFGMGCHIIGSALWSFIQDVPKNAAILMIFSRLIVGMGASISGVIRAQITKSTSLKERTKVMALATGFQCLGYCCGPVIQLAFTPLDFPGVVEVTGFHLNKYTAIGWLSAFIGIINFILIGALFEECEIPDIPGQLNVSVISDHDTSASIARYPEKELLYQRESSFSEYTVEIHDDDIKPDYLLIVFLNIWFFINSFNFVVIETISLPLGNFEFAWGEKENHLYTNVIWAVLAALTIVVVLLLSSKYFSFPDKVLLLVSSTGIVIAFAFFLPIGKTPHKIKYDNYTHVGGCPVKYKWCHTLPRITVPQYITAMTIYGILYPIQNIIYYSLFSKVLGPITQGTWMGIFVAVGSMARMGGPLFVTYSYDNFGSLTTFSTLLLLVIIALISKAVLYKRTRTFDERRDILNSR